MKVRGVVPPDQIDDVVKAVFADAGDDEGLKALAWLYGCTRDAIKKRVNPWQATLAINVEICLATEGGKYKFAVDDDGTVLRIVE